MSRGQSAVAARILLPQKSANARKNGWMIRDATPGGEGDGRFHGFDNTKVCSNALGSACEFLDHLITASDDGLIRDVTLLSCRAKLETTVRLTNGPMACLDRAGGQVRRS